MTLVRMYALTVNYVWRSPHLVIYLLSPPNVLLDLPSRPYLMFTRLKNVTVTCTLRSAV